MYQDIKALFDWSIDNKATFEQEKMSAMVISQKYKRRLFDASGLYFDEKRKASSMKPHLY